MKKIAYPFLIFVIVIIITSLSCHKSSIDPGCGCNTDSVWHYATYNNFGGFSSYNAMIGYSTANGNNGWFIGVIIPNTNWNAALKVCNPDLPAIKALTDTIPRNNGIPIRGVSIVFAGKLKKTCPNESWAGVTLPETLIADITIDSLKKN
jgi:hypothetical protein